MYSLTILEARSLRSRCWQVSPELTLAGLQMATFSCVLIGDGLFSVYEPPWCSYLSLSLFFFLAMPCGIQDFSSPTRDGTHDPAVEV